MKTSRILLSFFIFSLLTYFGCSHNYSIDDWNKLSNRDFIISEVQYIYYSSPNLVGKYDYETDSNFQYNLFKELPINDIVNALNSRYKIKVNASDLINDIKNGKELSSGEFNSKSWKNQNKSPNHIQIVIGFTKGVQGQSSIIDIDFEYIVNVIANNNNADTFRLNYVSKIDKFGLYEKDLKRRKEMANFFLGKNSFPIFRGAEVIGVSYQVGVMKVYRCALKDPNTEKVKVESYIKQIGTEFLKKWIASKNTFGS